MKAYVVYDSLIHEEGSSKSVIGIFSSPEKASDFIRYAHKKGFEELQIDDVVFEIDDDYDSIIKNILP